MKSTETPRRIMLQRSAPNGYMQTGIRLTALDVSRIVIYGLIVFFFIFSPKLFVGFEIHAGLVAAVFAAIFCIRGFDDIRFPGLVYFAWMVFVSAGVYHLLIANANGHDGTVFAMAMLGSSVSLFVGIMLSRVFIREFGERGVILLLQCIVVAVLLNSALVISEYFHDGLRRSIESYLVQDDLRSNINYMNHPFRMRGLSSGGGAALSVATSLGVLLTLSLGYKNLLWPPFAIGAAIVMAVSTIFMGRTGLILSMVIFSIYLMLMARPIATRLSPRAYIGVMIILAAAVLVIQNIELGRDVQTWAFSWIEYSSTGRINIVSNESTDDLMRMLILPQTSHEMLFGIGYFVGHNSLYALTDSGYLKTIFSVGMLAAVILYGTIIHLFIGKWKHMPQMYRITIPLVVLLAVVEIKEPFMYQNPGSRILFIIAGASLCYNSLMTFNARNAEKIPAVSGVA